jgi:hypothetical protein
MQPWPSYFSKWELVPKAGWIHSMERVCYNHKHMFWLCRATGKAAMFWDSAQQDHQVPTAIRTTKCKPSFVHFLPYFYALYMTVLQAVNQQPSTNIFLSTLATMHILQIHNQALFIVPNDTHYYKIKEMLKQFKIITLVPTCFGSRRNHHQGAVLCFAKTTNMVYLCLLV